MTPLRYTGPEGHVILLAQRGPRRAALPPSLPPPFGPHTPLRNGWPHSVAVFGRWKFVLPATRGRAQDHFQASVEALGNREGRDFQSCRFSAHKVDPASAAEERVPRPCPTAFGRDRAGILTLGLGPPCAPRDWLPHPSRFSTDGNSYCRRQELAHRLISRTILD